IVARSIPIVARCSDTKARCISAPTLCISSCIISLRFWLRPNRLDILVFLVLLPDFRLDGSVVFVLQLAEPPGQITALNHAAIFLAELGGVHDIEGHIALAAGGICAVAASRIWQIVY